MIDIITWRGTTDELELVLGTTDLSEVTNIWVTFSQYGTERFTKTLADVTIDGSSVFVPLTQTDTLKLKAKQPLNVQVRVLFASGDADCTDILRGGVGEILKDGVIT